MEYSNARLIMVAGIAEIYGRIEKAAQDDLGLFEYLHLLDLRDEKEAELADFDAQRVNHALDGSKPA
jgi:hypothetical protein